MTTTLRWLLVAILSSAVPVFAQLEASHWYFGQYGGVHMSAAGPSLLNDGLTHTIEGTASISDGWGNLLFYTDGRTIWNRAHNTMPNGTGLAGGASACQSALIVREPGSRHVYYVFTTFHMGVSPGLQYSVVDMEAEGGMGDVLIKNVPLQDPAAEKITAYKHENNIDVWVISHGFGNNEFQARLLTSDGVGPAVVSAVGSVHGMIPENAIGFMKFSPDGQWLASAIYKQNKVELFRFDRNTGQIYDPLTLMQDDWTYGLEFSPNSSKLYLTTQVSVSRVVQYDLSSGDYSAIPGTQTVVGIPSVAQPGGLALSPDGKIYMAGWTGFLSVIEHPDELGTACNYLDQNLALGGSALAKLSIPNFPAYLFAPNQILGEGLCVSDTSFFSIGNLADVDSVIWNFGDPASGIANTMNALNAWHIYSTPGIYTASAIVYGWGPPDTLSYTITQYSAPYVHLGSDTSLCPGVMSLMIIPEISGVSEITWHDGSTGPIFHATSPGLVWAMASNACAMACDSIWVVSASLDVELGDDRRICRQEGIWLSTGLDDMDYLWSNGSTSPEILVMAEGVYSVVVTDPHTGCSGVDSVMVTVVEVHIPLPATAELIGDELLLDAGNPGASYLWSTGEESQSIIVREPGIYTVSVTDPDGCTAGATVIVSKVSGLQSLQPSSLSLGPVPTTGMLQLNWQGAETLDAWGRILGADGRMVWMGRLLMAPGTSHQLQVHQAAAGTYILRIETRDGQWLSRTFIKMDP